jgi:hypothetical protein
MEASMSKRFESSIRHDTDGRVAQALREMPSASWEAQSERAVREAERILSETEGEHNSSLLHIERLQGSGRDDNAGRTTRYEGCVALADRLAAVLPVLDELAAQAGLEYGGCTAAYWQANAMAQRNRATLAAMGGR